MLEHEVRKVGSKQNHILCYLDLDQFKIVNDTCGHIAGDELLRQVTTLLENKVGENDTLARLGGDEFCLLLDRCSLERGKQIASELLDLVRAFQFVWEDKTFTIGVSIGLVAIDGEVESVTTILSAADSAMYAAKDRGRNRFHVYEAGDRDLVRRNGDMQWVSKIIKALEENRFRLYCQAIAPIKNKYSGYHYEILLRLQGENGVLVAPMAFIPAAERYNLMPQIDRWVVSSLFASLKDAHHQLQSLYTVNLSGASFNDDNFLDFLKQQFSIVNPL